MKSTGILRKIDPLGRLVIPRETRRMLEIETKDSLEIFVEGELIILQKYKPHGACPITGENSSQNVTLADGKMILSSDGAKQLLKELKTYLETV